MEFPLPTNIFLRGLKKFEILIPWGFDFGGKLGDFGAYASKLQLLERQIWIQKT